MCNAVFSIAHTAEKLQKLNWEVTKITKRLADYAKIAANAPQRIAPAPAIRAVKPAGA
jgi:hypothetical protein